jgi:hypothetical protein
MPITGNLQLYVGILPWQGVISHIYTFTSVSCRWRDSCAWCQTWDSFLTPRSLCSLTEVVNSARDWYRFELSTSWMQEKHFALEKTCFMPCSVKWRPLFITLADLEQDKIHKSGSSSFTGT